MSDRLPSFKYSHEIQPDAISTQDPAYPQTDADRKMGDRCVPQPGRQWGGGGSLSTTSCFAFTSLAKMNNILLQWEPVFISPHSSVVIRVQTNASNHIQLAATRDDFPQQNGSTWPTVDRLRYLQQCSHCVKTLTRSFALISIHVNLFSGEKKKFPLVFKI